MIEPNGSPIEHILIFESDRQHTWLVSTNLSLFCLLDDDNTRPLQKVIQWRQPLSAARRVHTKPYRQSSRTGLVDIGTKSNWLFSYHLHQPSDLERRFDCCPSPRRTW